MTVGVVLRMSNAVLDVVRLRMSRRTHLASGIVLGRASDTAAGTVVDRRCGSGRWLSCLPMLTRRTVECDFVDACHL